jgi:hypothetical protein
MEKRYTIAASVGRVTPIGLRNQTIGKITRTNSLSGSSSFFKSFALTLAIIFAGIGGVWGQTVETITTSQNWTCPAGVTSITITAVGGGGAGGGSSATDRNGGGGGGGASARLVNYAVTPGGVYSIVIGSGGTGVSANTGNTGASTTVSFNSTIFLRASGGNGGTRGANNTTAGVGGLGGVIANNIPVNNGFKGGNGGNSNPSTGSSDQSGGGGGGAGISGAGGNGGIITAGVAGAGGLGGAGGVGKSTTSSAGANGNIGNVYGGGGGGSTTWTGANRAGANGAAGVVQITYIAPALPPSCAASPTAPANASTNISVTQQLSWPVVSNTTGYDVYFGTSNPATTLVSTNQAGTAYNPGTMNPGTVYYWRIVPRNSSGSASGCSTWSFTTITPPSNDICANSTSLSCGTSNLAGTTVNSVAETAPGTCVGTNGVWYSFPGNGQLTTISAFSSMDIGVYIASGTCAARTQIQCIDNLIGNNTESSSSFIATNGITYFVYIANYTGSTTGTFTISRTCTAPPTPPANDLCANATTLTVSGSCTNTAGTTVAASQELPANPTCDPTGTIQDVWYKFNSGDNSTLNFGVTLGTAVGVGIEFFSSCGTVASGLSVGCDFTAFTPNPTVVSGFALNTEYFFRIYSNVTYDAAGTFNVCIYRNPAPTCATIVSPANGATAQNLTLNLQWSAPTYAERYDVYLSSNQTLVNNQDASVLVSTNQTSTTYVASGLNALTTYYWKVVSKNGSGSSTGCTTWSFTTAQPQYATSWISANTGDTWWCQGETRTVTVTLKNNGSVAWIDGGGDDYNVGVKWNNDADYNIRVDAQNLAAGATGTFTFTVTAPTAGNNNLTFDVVKEGPFWFGSNSNGAGPGNVTYSNVANINNTLPILNAGTDISACVGASASLSGSSSVNSTYSLTTSGGSFSVEKWVRITTGLNGSGTVVWAQGNGTIGNGSGWLTNQSINLSAYLGQTLYLNTYDEYDDGWDGSIYNLTLNGTTVINNGGASPTDGIDNDATDFWDASSAELESSEAFVVVSAPIISWAGPNSFASSSLTPSVSNTIGGANNYILSSTYRGCTATDVVQVTGTGPTTLATSVQNGDVVWRGASSTAWTTASNWYAYDGTNYTIATATPTASSSVIIPANQGCVTQQPSVAISGTVNTNNLTVETGAALTMGTTSVLNVAGNFTINGTGTFTPGTGTVNFTGNGTQVVTNGTQAFNNVTVSGFGTVQMTGNTTINGNFLNTAGTLDMNNFNLTVGGNYANYNSSSGLLPGTGTVIFNKASGTQTVDQLALDFNHIQHSGAGTLKLLSDLSTTGDIINSAGTFDANDKIITVRNNFTNTASFTPGTGGLGEIYFEKIGGTQTLTSGGAVFQKFAHTGNGTLNLSGIVEVKGDVVINAPISAGTSTLKLSGTGNQEMSGTEAVIALKDMTVAKTAGTVTLSKPVKVDGALTMSQGNIISSSANKLEIGSSTSSLGSVVWTSGNVVGPMRRWFAGATNSGASTGIFPVGLSNVNRYAQVNFTAAPGSGGYIDMEYKSGTPLNAPTWTYLTTPDGQLIQNYENEGYWDITPYDEFGDDYPSGLNNSAFTLKLRANGLASINDISVTRIIRSPGPDHTTWEPAGFHLASSGQITDFAIESNSVTGFSWFNIGAPNNQPLPVELLNFNGTCEEGMVNLVWQTASEFNSSHFDVEKSTDGETWRVLATIPSAGISNELLTYQTVDNNGTNGSNYYRLRQVDVDGKEKLYDPINVSCAETTVGYFTSYPNPSGNEFQVVVNNKEILGACTLNIVDAQGKVIDQRSIEVKDGINMFVISETLNPGIYFLNITNGTKTTQVIKHAVK